MIKTLAQCLAGEYDNQNQAQAQPVWFVPLRLWYRPLPHLIDGHLALFAEQANVLSLDCPYRQRVVILKRAGDRIQAQYLALKQPDQFQGAGADSQKLQKLDQAQLEVLSGCILDVVQQQKIFIAQLQPDAKCCFEYQGQQKQVVLGFEVGQHHLFSYDRGVDPKSGQGLWGALMGPYEFYKRKSFAQELPQVSL